MKGHYGTLAFLLHLIFSHTRGKGNTYCMSVKDSVFNKNLGCLPAGAEGSHFVSGGFQSKKKKLIDNTS